MVWINEVSNCKGRGSKSSYEVQVTLKKILALKKKSTLCWVAKFLLLRVFLEEI